MRSEDIFPIKASVKIRWFIKIWHRVRGGNGCTLPVWCQRLGAFKPEPGNKDAFLHTLVLPCKQ